MACSFLTDQRGGGVTACAIAGGSFETGGADGDLEM
jgi:hypothetical protein